MFIEHHLLLPRNLLIEEGRVDVYRFSAKESRRFVANFVSAISIFFQDLPVDIFRDQTTSYRKQLIGRCQ